MGEAGAREELGGVAVVRGRRSREHLLQRDGELVGAEGAAFPYFLAKGYDPVPGIESHQFLSPVLIFWPMVGWTMGHGRSSSNSRSWPGAWSNSGAGVKALERSNSPAPMRCSPRAALLAGETWLTLVAPRWHVVILRWRSWIQSASRMSGLRVVTTTCMERPAWRKRSRMAPRAPGCMVASGFLDHEERGSSMLEDRGEQAYNTERAVGHVEASNFTGLDCFQSWANSSVSMLPSFLGLEADGPGDDGLQKLQDALPVVGRLPLDLPQHAGGVAPVRAQAGPRVRFLHLSNQGRLDLVDLHPHQESPHCLESGVARDHGQGEGARLHDRIQRIHGASPVYRRALWGRGAIEPVS